jgi:hypothetical protein
MSALNLRYEASDLVTEIYKSTAGRANLMTTACDEIIKSLDRRERTISRALVHKVLHGFALRSRLEGWSNLNSNNGSDDGISRETSLDRILVYSTAQADPFTFMDVQHRVKEPGLEYTADEIRESLARLTLAVIVNCDDGIHYHYCIPIFLEYLRTQDLTQARLHAIAEARSAQRR